MPRSYQQTLRDLYALEARKGMDFNLARLEPVLEALGRPERAFERVVHLAGTNGKGSTAAMIDGALRAGGHATGLYTSPHLVSFRERIRVNGQPIDADAVVRQVDAVEAAAARSGAWLTFFEITTIAALLEMRERGVRVAVVEAGLGGRLDATNVLYGDVAVITSVGIDHAEYLGGTIAAIAAEKAAIIKRGSVAVTGPVDAEADELIERRVREVGASRLAWGRELQDYAPLVAARCDGLAIGLAGAHQVRNAAIAAAVVGALAADFPVSDADRDRGILGARWPGRLEVLPRRRGAGPLILDAAHNPDGAKALAVALDALAARRPRVLVFAAMADKDWRAMLAELLPHFDAMVASPLPMARAERPEAFLAVAPDATVAIDPEDALERAEQLAAAHGSIVVAGSIFLLGNLYRAAGGRLLEEDLAD